MSLPISTQTQTVLDELHAAAALDSDRWRERAGQSDDTRNAAGGGDLVRLGEFFLGVSPSEGRLMYLLARAGKAKRIVEFGASFGISSLYLGAAVQANDGEMITTEVHPDKCQALRASFQRAGLSETITLLEGDARETLAGVPGPVDLLFLDGWKSHYLPVFNLMRPKLIPGSLVLADNCHHEGAKDFLETVQAPQSGCMTEILDDLAITCVVS